MEHVQSHTHTQSGCASVYIWDMLLEEIYAQARFSMLVRGEKAGAGEKYRTKDCGIL